MTKTDAENTPSDALTAWQKAFFTKDAKAFTEGFAENVVLEASVPRDAQRDKLKQSKRNSPSVMLYAQKAEESVSDWCTLIQKGEEVRWCRGQKQSR